MCLGLAIADRQDLGLFPLVSQDAPHGRIALDAAAKEGTTDEALLGEADLLQDSL
jgi:hypothetical protein